jgi:NHL repeat.
MAGNGSNGSTDGNGSNASFILPYRLALDSLGNIYVTDRANNNIRRIDSSGNVTTITRNTSPGSKDGNIGIASFDGPRGISIDSSGNIYVADGGNNKIRMIKADGNVYTLSGTGSEGFLNGSDINASFNNPVGIASGLNGSIYVADYNNHVIRKLIYSNSSITSITDNHTFQEIFRGSTQHTVTEGTNSLNLRLSPLLDDRELTVPRITRINRPFQMVASTSDNITVVVDTVKKDGSSAFDATLSYRFRSVDNDSLPLDNITGGSFTPASGDVTKTGSS